MYVPEVFKKFTEDYPEISAATQKVGKLCSEAGPLDEKTMQLIQTGIAAGAVSKGGVRSHVRRALKEGASQEEILHTILLATSTIGFPAMIASYGWAKDVLDTDVK
jgi:alkylhydroperoxidase/carboxymuconolactone decarboxylase family protein YurZ